MSRLRTALGAVLGYVLVEPVRSGRLRRTDWPPGLSAVAGVALVTCLAMVGLTIASGAVRHHSELLFASPSSTLPRWTLAPLTAALVLALGCLYAGVLHVRPLVRIPALVVVCAIVTTVVALVSPERAVPTIAAAGVLLAIAVARWRASFAWWEPVLATLVVGVALAYSLALVQADQGAGIPAAPLVALEEITTTPWLLAEPFALLAGATVSELLAATVAAVCATAGSAGVARRPSTGPVLVAAVLGLLVVARGVQIVHGIRSDDAYGPGLLGGALVLAVPATALLAASRSRPARERLGTLDAETGLRQWRRWALLAAGLVMALVDGQFLLSQVCASFGLRAAAEEFLDARFDGVVLNPSTFTALALVLVAAWERRRTGRWPFLLLALAWVFVAQVVDTAVDLAASGQASLALASLLAAGTAVGLGVRRRLTAPRAVPLAAVLLLTGLFGYRDAVTEPLTALLALSGVTVALVVGVVWRLLTDLGFGNGASERFPRPARVLLALANVVFGASGVALLALQGGVSATDLSRTENLGDTQLGFALVLAVSLASLYSAWSQAPAASR